MRVLITYFSRTGHTRHVAEELAKHLSQRHEVELHEIHPLRERSYFNWLARSFVPRSQVAIESGSADLTPYDLVLLGTPKWTLSCPPVNRYLSLTKATSGQPLGIFMTFGGFDQERYLRALVRRLGAQGFSVVGALALKRDRVAVAEIALFGDEVLRTAAERPVLVKRGAKNEATLFPRPTWVDPRQTPERLPPEESGSGVRRKHGSNARGAGGACGHKR